ncbi:hypothetical protein [Geminocystis herdmanii]|nr:hypothetical protein [Geminocystis herdmanii]
MIRHLMTIEVIQGVDILSESRFSSCVMQVSKSRVALDKKTVKIISVIQS